jgi:Zn-dependent protease
MATYTQDVDHDGGTQPPAYGRPGDVPAPPTIPDVGQAPASPPVSQPGGDGTPWGTPGQLQENPDGSRTEAPPGSAPRNGKRTGIVGGIISAGYLLLKLGASIKFILIPLAKAPFLLSILANIVLYAIFFGAQNPVYGVAFATGFVGLIFIHEMGHLIAARYEGINATVPFFIPFMGAAIFLRGNPRDARSEAIIGIGGPITGTLGALAMFGLAQTIGAAGDPLLGLLFARLAFYGFLINLFNMIPMSPLDGGRILGAVSRWFNVLGLGMIVLGVVTGYLASPIILLVLLFGAFGLYRRFTRPELPGYYEISAQSKAVIGLSYLLLLAILIGGIVATEPFMVASNF